MLNKVELVELIANGYLMKKGLSQSVEVIRWVITIVSSSVLLGLQVEI